MRCPECERENREEARFCDACGTRLTRVCAGCGAEARSGSRFCDQCGQPLSAPAPASAPTNRDAVLGGGRSGATPAGYTPRHLAEKILTSRSALEGERKLVTVVFADCVGFTALSTRIDPEELHEVMDGFFERVLEGVHQHEGTVNQFTGDGVMALFGAPIAHEDHAVRAAAAALACQHALADYAERLRRERGLELSARMGIHTGLVVVGRIGDDLRMDYTAQGETVNVAARLQAAAAPGTVLASEATHRLIGDYFDCESRGELALKGLDHPIAAVHVLRRRPRRGRFDVARERGLTPLVGRRREIAFLAEAFDRALLGRGQVVSLVGDAGAGKSRLLHELRMSRRDGTADWCVADCGLRSEGLAFDVVVQILECLFGFAVGDSVSLRRSKLETGVTALGADLGWTIAPLERLLSLPGGDLEADGLDQAQRKQRLIDAVKGVTARRSSARPLVIMIDDIHEVDPSSGELLESLVQSVGSHAILLLSTQRRDVPPSCPTLASQHRLTVDPLDAEEAHAMARSLLPGDGVDELCRRIVERAEGNPLFLEELAAYVSAGSLDDSGPALIPETVRDLVAARVDRLSQPVKQTLQLASILGSEFRRSVLAAIAPHDLDLDGALADLVRQGLLQEGDLFPEPRHRFVSAITRNVTYEGMLQRTRGELHARAGEAIERIEGEFLDEVAAELAEHFSRGAEPSRAVGYWVRAGDRAERVFAHHEACAFYTRARALEPDDDAVRGEVLEKLGDAAFANGAIAAAIENWEEAIPCRVGEARRVADLHRRIGAAAWAAGNRDRALAAFERGLASLGGDGENLEAARIYQELGRIHFRLGHHDPARRFADRALDLGERLGAADVVSHAHNTLGVTAARGGDLEAGAVEVERSLETALAAQLGSVACRAYTNLAVMVSPFDPARSADYCRAGITLAERIGDRLQQSWLYCALAGGQCTIAGDYDEGSEAAKAAIELDERLGQRGHLPIPLILLAQIHQCRGDLEGSAEHYRRALEVAESVGEPQMLLPCYEGLATLAIERGDEAEADRWLELGGRAQSETGSSTETFVMLPFLC